MKSIQILSLFLVTWTASFGQVASLKGNIKGLEDGALIFYNVVDGEEIADTVQTKDGQFVWTGVVKEPHSMMIMFPNQFFPFYVEAKEMTIAGSADSISHLRVSGSALQDEASAFKLSLRDLAAQQAQIYEGWGKGGDMQQRENMQKLEEIDKKVKDQEMQYIKENPKSLFSLDLANRVAQMGSYDEVKPLYDALDTSMKNKPHGKKLSERINILQRSRIGNPILRFTQNDQEGKPVDFDMFKGSYVLIDFWASWCAPCREENPNVLKQYNLYKDRNFTVLGISLDDNDTHWKKAIIEDALPWVQVSDLKGFDNEVSSYYGIGGIPSTLLVDPEGKIIARNLRGESLAKKLEEIFGSNE